MTELWFQSCEVWTTSAISLRILFFLDSYCGAQIFEIYGLGQEVVDLAFCGSVSKIGGLTLDEVFYNFSVRYFKSLERHSSKHTILNSYMFFFLCLT